MVDRSWQTSYIKCRSGHAVLDDIIILFDAIRVVFLLKRYSRNYSEEI